MLTRKLTLLSRFEIIAVIIRSLIFPRDLKHRGETQVQAKRLSWLRRIQCITASYLIEFEWTDGKFVPCSEGNGRQIRANDFGQRVHLTHFFIAHRRWSIEGTRQAEEWALVDRIDSSVTLLLKFMDAEWMKGKVNRATGFETRTFQMAKCRQKIKPAVSVIWLRSW